MAAMLTCSLDLRPLVWQQSVEHHTGMNVEGRRFSANCTVGRGSDLRLSNKLPLKELPVAELIFETTRMPAELATLGVAGVPAGRGAGSREPPDRGFNDRTDKSVAPASPFNRLTRDRKDRAACRRQH